MKHTSHTPLCARLLYVLAYATTVGWLCWIEHSLRPEYTLWKCLATAAWFMPLLAMYLRHPPPLDDAFSAEGLVEDTAATAALEPPDPAPDYLRARPSETRGMPAV